MTAGAESPIVVSGVGHRYGATEALVDVSLRFAAGASCAIIGPDGVGKSTLLGLVTGVRRLQTGDIQVFGGSMRDRVVRDGAAPRVAYMPQGLGRNLYPTLSVAENIDFHARLFGLLPTHRAARIDRLLAATGLAPFRDRRAGQLSGGMKQKLSLCCALVHDPDLLVLDEPTTGVDPLSRRQFWDLIDDIRRQRAEMTVLVATAYMDEAARFDRVIALDDGHVIADGTLSEILAKTGAATLEDAYRHLGRRDGEVAPTFVMPPRTPTPGDWAISADGLTRRFGDFTAVDHVSFQIERGEIFGFLGSNGCGKTTTMKMLTGLLPATEGTATLLGQPVDADDLAVRLRVGYVSQSFSLYDELTVRANLTLHARLYRVAEAEVAARVADSLARFDLVAHADALPAALPLGIRQRLQLAAACLHRPEVLILDEPTSGVDPQARDDFWRHLAGLSRDSGVTIFVSTHFMNEAERCDRISLMHQGRVLAIGAPGDLVRDAGAASLEAVFIAALETAAGPKETTEDAPEAVTDAPTAAKGPVPRGRLARFASATTVWSFARREGLEIVRDPVRLSFAVLGSLLLLILFGYGISFDVQNLPIAVHDRDRSIESGQLTDAFAGSPYFKARPPIVDERDIDRRLISGELRLVVSIPPGYGADLMKGARPEVAILIDGANTFRAETVKAYVQGVILTYVTQLAHVHCGPTAALALPFDLRPRYAYNQAFVSVDAITPGVIMLLLMLIPSAMTAVGVAREREIGSITNFAASPASVVDFMIGKQLPYVAIGLVSYLTLVTFARLFFGVPFAGSFVALSLGALLYILAATGFGLLVSTLVRTQVAAIMGAAILCVVPSINFSGFINPMSSIDGVARWVGLLFPSSWFQTIAIGSFAKGVSGFDLITPDLALAGFAAVFISVACLLLDKQET